MPPPHDASSYPTIPPSIFYGGTDGHNPHSTPHSAMNSPPLDFNAFSRLPPPSLSITTAAAPEASMPGIGAWLANIPVGEKWREVAKRVQEAGYCKGKDVDTLKNKVTSLLNWVEVLATQSVLSREAEGNPAVFASLLGRLDAMASMRAEAKELTDKQHDEAKKAKDVDKRAGEDMHQAMMAPHKSTKWRKRASWSTSDGSASDKENWVAAPTPTSGSVLEIASSMLTTDSSKRRRLVPPSRAGRLNEAVTYMKEQEVKNDKYKEEMLSINKESLDPPAGDCSTDRFPRGTFESARA
ncbi:hypothetical protein JB92DRAFT_3093703 [Gautieria morchelliformis]|nr:hypothetical protein JB92DRAFT_3093703 [Gautieria morchelliformis]